MELNSNAFDPTILLYFEIIKYIKRSKDDGANF